ncbi:hypothetical protein [Aureivirga sp. CE67]|uniref:hypothetical protein n=1 Tax=Aureivirga sp. CE67 TaxID=1788983 RepID=UPI0018CB3BB0|nr:hypothetical protein [Aureivirga sp. CE67]
MKNKIWIILSFLCLFVLFGYENVPSKNNNCRKGSYSYSVANYSQEFLIKKEYSSLFDSLLQEPVLNYFCETKIKKLPGRNSLFNRETKNAIDIEPFFIDLKNMNGLYGYRHWYTDYKRKNYRFLCGYIHHLFVIADDRFYPLKDDSTYNVNLLKSKLNRTFKQEQIDSMISFGGKNDDFCSHLTYVPPVLIKKDTVELWNTFEENKKTNSEKE